MNKYDSIINLPHYELKNHKRMSIKVRSAQFSPFAALVGYSDEIHETARITESKIEISDDMKSIIDMKLQLVENNIKQKPQITILYFEKDKRKSGGKYIEYTGNVKKIDLIDNIIIFVDGKKISLNNILDLNADLIKE